MSVKREDNICTITFEDENWKEEAPEVFTVTDGAVPFYTADTWKYNKKNTFRSGEIGNSATSETTIKVMQELEKIADRYNHISNDLETVIDDGANNQYHEDENETIYDKKEDKDTK